MKAICPEAMCNGSLFSFVSSGMGKGKGRLTWNSMDTCGGSWSGRKFFVVDIYSCFYRQSVVVKVLLNEVSFPALECALLSCENSLSFAVPISFSDTFKRLPTTRVTVGP